MDACSIHGCERSGDPSSDGGYRCERHPFTAVTGHTSAPWESTPSAVPDGYVQHTVYGPSGDRVAVVFENVANVPLVANAPALLAASRGVLRMLDAYGYGDVPAREVEALRLAIYDSMDVPT